MFKINCSAEDLQSYIEMLNTLAQDFDQFDMPYESGLVTRLRRTLESAQDLNETYVVTGIRDNGVSRDKIDVIVQASDRKNAQKQATRVASQGYDTTFKAEKTSAFSQPMIRER